MKIKKHLLAASIALVVSIPAKSFATIIAGIEIPGGGFLDIGTIYEGSKASDGTAPILAVGDELVGVGKVDAIKTAGGTTVWSDGDNGRELLLYFDGYKTQAINPLGAPTPINILFSGGAAHFYSGAAGGFTPTGSFAVDSAFIAASGPLWMDTIGGTTRTCVAADACTDGVGTAVTLESFILSGTLGAVGTGTGSGFLDVTGAGLADPILDTNNQPLGGPHDITLTSSFTSQTSTAGYAASGSLDLRGSAIPEPASLSLIGLGLLGAGFSARKKRAKASA